MPKLLNVAMCCRDYSNRWSIAILHQLALSDLLQLTITADKVTIQVYEETVRAIGL